MNLSDNPNHSDDLRREPARTTRSRRLTLLCCLSALWHPALAPSLAAQDLLDTLVVQAEEDTTGEETRQLDAVATLSGGANVEHLLLSEPNAFVGGGLGVRFSLRGLSQDGTPTVGTRTNSVVGVTSGVIPRSTNTLWLFGGPTWDSHAVRIDRGPVLFGPGAVYQGGALWIEPNPPVFDHEGRLLLEAGEQGYVRGGITENVVLVPDKLALRLNAAVESTDGAITNVTLDDDRFAAYRRNLYRGQLRWLPAGDGQSVWDLLFEAEELRGNPLGLATTLPGGDFFDRHAAVNVEERVPVDRRSASLRGRVELDPSTRVEGELTWQELDGYQHADLDAGPVLDWFFLSRQRERRLTSGTRLVREDDRLSWTAGIYAETSDYIMDFEGIGFPPVPDGVPFESRLEEEVDMAAVFVRGEYEVRPGVWAFGGVRLDHQERNVSNWSVVGAAPPGSGTEHVGSTEWLPELGMEWRGDESKVGLKLSRAYRPAGVARAVTLGITSPYGAERGWEANAYAEKRWDRVRSGFRVFVAELDNQQVPFVIAGGIPILDEFIANSGRSTRAGSEIEIAWEGPGDLSVGVAGGFLYTSYDELVLNGVDRSGQEFPNAPEWSASLEVAWSPACGWFGESLLSWTDTSYSEVGSPAATGLEKRLLLSARVGYRWERAEAYLFGTNLLDEDFALVRHDYRAIGRGIDGAPNSPRLIGAGVSVEW